MHGYEIQRCAQVSRWGIIEISRSQSILEHMGAVAMLTGEMCARMEVPRLISLEAVNWALHHDKIEIFTGDIPSPFKAILKEAGFNPDPLMAQALGESDWMEIQERLTDYAKDIVKFADLTEAWAYVRMYGRGHRANAAIQYMETLWTEARDRIPVANEIPIEDWNKAVTVAHEYFGVMGVGKLERR